MPGTATFDVPAFLRPTYAPVESAFPVEMPVPTEWQMATVATLEEVEEILDRTERLGYSEREVAATQEDNFHIRWR